MQLLFCVMAGHMKLNTILQVVILFFFYEHKPLISNNLLSTKHSSTNNLYFCDLLFSSFSIT